jgi:hypothetical protein
MNRPLVQLNHRSIAVQLLLAALPWMIAGCAPVSEARDPSSTRIIWIREAADRLARSDCKPLESRQLAVALDTPDIRAPYEDLVRGLAISPHGQRQTVEHQQAVARQLEGDYQWLNSVLLKQTGRRMAPLNQCELWVYDLRSRSPAIAPEGWYAYVFFIDHGSVLGSTYLSLWQEK